MHPPIECENLSFAYGETLIFDKASLKIEKGKHILIIGPNGGGKSTLLKLCLGLLKPLSGTIRLKGLPPEEASPFIGYVPQQTRTDPLFPITVEQVVLSAFIGELTIWGSYPQYAIERSLFSLQEAGLEKLKDRPFGSLSGGEQQRVRLLRALVKEPEILLLDEPASHLDPWNTQAFYHLLKPLLSKKTILHVTHQMDESLIATADQIFCIQHGIKEISAKELCHHYSLGLYHPRGGNG